MSPLQVREWGAGMPVVFLNGVCSPHDHLDDIGKQLSNQFRVLIPSLPGYGTSARAAAPYDFHQVNQDAAVALRDRGVTEAVIVGFSLGATRAIDIAVSSVLHVRGMVLLGAAAAWSDEVRRGYAGLAALMRARSVPSGLIPGLLLSPRYLEGHSGAAEEVDGYCANLDLDASADELEALSLLEDMLDAVSTLRCPIHLRVGSRDRAVPVEASEAIRERAPDATLEVVEGVGHMQHWEDPVGLANSIRSFLRLRVGVGE